LGDDEMSELTIVSRQERSNASLVLLYAGVLSRDRMPLLENLVTVVEEFESLTLEVAGKGEMEAFFRHRFRNTEYMGLLSHSQTLLETAGCDCVVIPYDSDMINNRIGLPNKLFEALACSRPILAQRGTLAATIIEEHGCGFGTDFKDPNELRLTLKTILRERSELPKMGERGRELFEERYRWSFSESRLTELYDDVRRGE
jgi:glycosyltransferase involved in cell wall biosynthesis